MATKIGLKELRKNNGKRLSIFLNEFIQEEDLIYEGSSGSFEYRRIGEIELYDTSTNKYVSYTPTKASQNIIKIRDAILAKDEQARDILEEPKTKTAKGPNQIRVYPVQAGSKTKLETAHLPFAKLVKTEVFGGTFSMDGPGEAGGGGVDTEIYSEILSMYCLSYFIVKNQAITKDTFNSGGDLIADVWPAVQKRCHIPPSLFKFSDKKDREKLVKFAIEPKKFKIGKFNWLDCCIAQSKKVKENISIDNTCHVFNDKFYANLNKDTDPYKAYLQSGNTAKPDKWNPADMWVMNRFGLSEMRKFNRESNLRTASVITLNEFLVKQWEDGNIYPISLKKLNPTSPHFSLVNSNEYVERINISNQTNPLTIEFTDTGSRGPNRDVKINFVLETIKLSPNTTAEQAQRDLFGTIGRVVEGSQKSIRLKFKVSTRGMELEYEQTKGGSKPSTTKSGKLAEAKMGALGSGEYNRLISDTSKEGIMELNKIKEKYNNTDLVLDNNTNSFTSHSLRIANPGSAQQALAGQYLDSIWEAINGDTNYDKEYYLRNNTYLQDKIISGEIGISIHKIQNEKIKRTVIQNLYNACASVGIIGGISAGNDEELLDAVGSGLSNMQNIDFLGGIHGKVF